MLSSLRSSLSKPLSKTISHTIRMSSSSGNKFTVNNLFNVDGWVAVVSGGGTGIGLMIAQALANNGAKVYITSRRSEVLQSTVSAHGGSNLAHPNGALIPLQCDITDKQSIKSLVDEITKKESHIDLLVNNAGVSEGSSEVEKGHESAEALSKELFNEDFAAWENVYRTNVIGYFFMTAGFLPLLSTASAKKPGYTSSVINISSMSGITRTSQHHFKYNVSKGAAIHLNTLLAQELRRPGVKVRVNSIAPGIFPSEMTTEGSDEKNKSSIPVDDSYGEKKGIPAGRPGSEEDMAQAVLGLACNQYAYGQTVVFDGGYLLEHP